MIQVKEALGEHRHIASTPSEDASRRSPLTVAPAQSNKALALSTIASTIWLDEAQFGLLIVGSYISFAEAASTISRELGPQLGCEHTSACSPDQQVETAMATSEK